MRLPAYLGALVLVATPTTAELRPAPDYFIGALIATEVAQAVAVNCPVLSINPKTAQQMSEDVMSWLEADGFDAVDPASDMQDPSESLLARQSRFMDKHNLRGANSEQVCAAGLKEIADETDIGSLLIEVPE